MLQVKSSEGGPRSSSLSSDRCVSWATDRASGVESRSFFCVYRSFLLGPLRLTLISRVPLILRGMMSRSLIRSYRAWHFYDGG